MRTRPSGGSPRRAQGLGADGTAQKLRGFERAQPRQIWRRFLKSPAHVRVTPTEVVVELPRRAHNPVLIASGLLDERTAVPRWNGRQLRFEIP